MRYLIVLSTCFCALALPAIAQQNRAEWLFSCSLNDAENTVGVHIYGDEITYHYANADGAIELNLNDSIENVGLILALWDDPNFTESVTFTNGDTTYEVFSEAGRNRPLGDKSVLAGGRVDGGILVTTPDGRRTEFLCDPFTVEPQNPLMRFARLQSMRDPNYTLIEDCSASGRMSDLVCADILHQLCYDSLPNGAAEMRCVVEDLMRREVTLSNAYSSARLMAQDRGDVDALDVAQINWIASRDADCAIAAWTIYNVFDGDIGIQSCLADYATARINFLEAYMAGLEFDG